MSQESEVLIASGEEEGRNELLFVVSFMIITSLDPEGPLLYSLKSPFEF